MSTATHPLGGRADGRAARRPDRDPAAAAAPLRRAAAAAPLALQLQPIGPLSRFVARRYTSAVSGSAPTGAMFLGRQVDDAITLYYRRILEHGEQLSLDQVKDAYWDGWKAAAEAEREQLGIAWEDDLREDRAFKLGLDAIELTFKRARPAARRAGRRAAPGRVHARARARVERPLLPRPRDPAARRRRSCVAAVVDYKVKTTPLTPVEGRPRLPAGRVPRRALARGRSRFQDR